MSWLRDRIGNAEVERFRIDAGAIILRPPILADFEQWIALRAQSRQFLEPWEPLWPPDHLSEAAYRSFLARARSEIRADESYPFFLFDKAKAMLLGGITLSFVRRRAAQSATLGYWMGEGYAGRGHMSAAVLALCRFSFVQLNLSRLEAACLPENTPSIRVLEKVGFRREGYVRGYLNIAGRRRDHLLYGCLPGDLPLLSHERM